MSGIISGGLSESDWIRTETAGVDYAVLRREPGAHATVFVRMAAGTHGAEHGHPGGEELFVVSGDVTVGGRRLRTGDYLYTPPGLSHDIDAHADSVLFVSLPKSAVFG